MYCEKLFEGLNKRLEDKLNIDQLAEELCPSISKKREKIIKLIKMHKGGEYLIKNADWLGYNLGNIRNMNNKQSDSKNKSIHLFKPCLNTRSPSIEEVKKWRDILTRNINDLEQIKFEIANTTLGRFTWKVAELSDRTKNLRDIIIGKSNE